MPLKRDCRLRLLACNCFAAFVSGVRQTLWCERPRKPTRRIYHPEMQQDGRVSGAIWNALRSAPTRGRRWRKLTGL